jgi:hypothetical protein
MKVANAIHILQQLNPEDHILFEILCKENADRDDWGCELTDDREYIPIPKEVWNKLVETIEHQLQWEQLGDSVMEFVHDEFVTLANEQKEIDKEQLQLWEA